MVLSCLVRRRLTEYHYTDNILIQLYGGLIMPVIRKSSDLRNKYAEISNFCHKYREPVFITKNGDGDLAVMSIETYAGLAGQNELYALIQEGLDQAKQGKTKPMKEAIESIRSKIK
jgi:PHD/YefM family antitoxin component YafN of YafNO toxin-antitoxin module